MLCQLEQAQGAQHVTATERVDLNGDAVLVNVRNDHQREGARANAFALNLASEAAQVFWDQLPASNDPRCGGAHRASFRE
jgi:hypothetical protein